MELILRSIKNSVRPLSAARCRYVKSCWPSRKRSYSSGTGSLTLTIRSAASKTSSGPSTSRAPASSYSSSEKPAPSPAPACTTTSWPWCTSSATPSGCIETRPSMSLISLGTPITVAMTFLSLTAPKLTLPYSKVTINVQGCCQRPLLTVGNQRLLACPPAFGGCIGTQPQGDMVGLHRLSDHRDQLLAEGRQVGLVP